MHGVVAYPPDIATAYRNDRIPKCEFRVAPFDEVATFRFCGLFENDTLFGITTRTVGNFLRLPLANAGTSSEKSQVGSDGEK